MRIQCAKSSENLFLNDWHIATEMVFYELHKSIFHYTVSIGKDVQYLLNPSYPTSLNCITFNFIKYQLSSDSIEELIKSFNKSDSVFLYRLHGNIIDRGEFLEAFLTISDKYANIITDYRMCFYFASSNKKDFKQKWIKLPTINEKVFLFVEEKEKVLIDEFDYLIHSLCINVIDIIRIKYILSHELRKSSVRFYLDKLAEKLKYSDRFSLIHDIEKFFSKDQYSEALYSAVEQIKKII